MMPRDSKQVINVIFRYDDYSSLSPTSFESKMLTAFQSYRIPLTIGVIPFISNGNTERATLQGVIPIASAKTEYLSDALHSGGLEIGLHGYSHQTTISMAGKSLTEYAGLDYTAQSKKISNGKKYLEDLFGVAITTFIPPWNSYDQITLQVAEQEGLKTISPGSRCAARKYSKLNFLPSTCGLLDLPKAVRAARKWGGANPIIVVMYHAYDFFEVNQEKGMISYQDFVQLLAWLKSQMDVCAWTISEVVAFSKGLDFYHYRAYCDTSRICRFLFKFNIPFYPTKGRIRTVGNMVQQT